MKRFFLNECDSVYELGLLFWRLLYDTFFLSCSENVIIQLIYTFFFGGGGSYVLSAELVLLLKLVKC